MDIIRMVGEFAEALGVATELPRLGDLIVKTLSQQTRLQEAALWIRELEAGPVRLLASHC